MADQKPTLKLVTVHRKEAAAAILTARATYSSNYRTIPSGSLRGCFHRVIGPNQRSIYKHVKGSKIRGHVIEFVIRVSL